MSDFDDVAFDPRPGDRLRMRGGKIDYEVVDTENEDDPGSVHAIRCVVGRGALRVSVSPSSWKDLVFLGASTVERAGKTCPGCSKEIPRIAGVGALLYHECGWRRAFEEAGKS